MEPDDQITDADRAITRRVVQDALARDEVQFGELDDRFAAIYTASSRAELDAVIADLPTPPPPVPVPRSHPLSGSSFSVFGDLKRGGDLEVGRALSFTAIFGDVVLDLSTSMIVDGAHIAVTSVFGDATLILPDGVRVEQQAFTVFGDQKVGLVPPFGDSPTVTVATRLVFGDSKIYSLSQVPDGPLRRLWKALRRS